MARLIWDNAGDRLFEAGVSKGVIYPKTGTNNTYATGVAWNGLTQVTESPSGGEASAVWADDIKYLNLISREELGGTIEAYMYPDEFAVCDGSAELDEGVVIRQQNRKPFGLCYQTRLGNDEDGVDHGYKIHILYNVLASPAERSYSTINESTEPITMSWSFTTTPEAVPGHKPTALITIDSTKVDATKLAQLEDILYGKDAGSPSEPRLPAPSEIISIFGT